MYGIFLRLDMGLHEKKTELVARAMAWPTFRCSDQGTKVIYS
jgi:hypothetical protein